MSICVLGVLLCGLHAAGAPLPHPVLATTANVVVKGDGRVELTVRHDALAFALNDLAARVPDEAMVALVSGPRVELEKALAEGRQRFETLMEVTADGTKVGLTITGSPTAEQVMAWKESGAGGGKPLFPVKLEFAAQGIVQPGAKTLVLRFPEVMGDVVLTVQTPGNEPLGTMVRMGERSEEFVLGGGAAAAVKGTPGDAAGQQEKGTPSVGSFGGAMRFVGMGITHILPGPEYFKALHERIASGKWFTNMGELVPDGADHILFVLGLFFLSPKIRPLLIQITAFTIAHSVTLALSARGVVNLPSSVVEPMIAASIALVAVENVFTQKVHAWRPIVVFCFGLVHGLGFAASFAEAFGAARVPLGPVLLFNVGVEIGQLAVVGIALLTVGWWREKKWYRGRVAIPASVVIACIGLYWTVQRVFF